VSRDESPRQVGLGKVSWDESPSWGSLGLARQSWAGKASWDESPRQAGPGGLRPRQVGLGKVSWDEG
jgi:hypothetical protein